MIFFLHISLWSGCVMLTLKQKYKNQVDRIRRALKASSKRGFVFDESATLQSIVKKPKKITLGTINRLKKLTAGKLREKYGKEFVDFSTGKTYSKEYGEKYGKYHNKNLDNLAVDAADVIIENFVNHVGQWVIYKKGGKGQRDYSFRDYALNWLSGMLKRYPKPVIAEGLQAAADAGAWVSAHEVYAIGVETAVAMIASYIDMPKSEYSNMVDASDGYDGDYYNLEEYMRDNIYYSDLYTF